MVSDPQVNDTAVKPGGPAAPPAQAPAGPDPFAQMVQAMEAELRSNEARRGVELKEARDAGEDVAAMEKAHAEIRTLEQKNAQLAKALMGREQLLQQAYIAEIHRDIQGQAQRYGLDEAKVIADFLKTSGSPEDLARVVQQHRLDKFEAAQASGEVSEEEEPPRERYDSALTTSRSGPDLSKLTPSERLRYALEQDARVRSRR